jgi:hypothetical protein
MITLKWTNPRGIDLSAPFVYFVRVVEPCGREYQYVGKARHGDRQNEYATRIARILKGRRREQPYRAVHLALAKACELGWDYEIYPLESCTPDELLTRERHYLAKLRCNLNGARTWSIEQYPQLSPCDLVAK